MGNLYGNGSDRAQNSRFSLVFTLTASALIS